MNMNKQLLLKMYILAGITLFGLIAVGILGNYLDLMFYYPLTTPAELADYPTLYQYRGINSYTNQFCYHCLYIIGDNHSIGNSISTK